MGESAGAGSPVFFHCWRFRKEGWRDPLSANDRAQHRVLLTGRERPYRSQRRSMLGTRSTTVSREYICSCGHRGWSNHIDLARMAGAKP
jgi:hypothetical protein